MGNEKVLEYDYGSSLSFVVSLQSICTTLAGFIFTGITLVLTLEEGITFVSQIVLFILFVTMNIFIGAMYELNVINNLVSLHSPKPIIPVYPARWRRIDIFMTLGTSLMGFSISLMFLLKNLIPLFVISSIIGAIMGVWGRYQFKSVGEELRNRGIRA